MTNTRTSPSGPEVPIPDPTPQGVPFAQVRYIDPRAESFYPDIDPALQDGSPAFPFSNFAALVASVPFASQPLTIVCAPGDYTSAGTLDLDAFSVVHLKGMQATPSATPNIGDVVAPGFNLAELVVDDLSCDSMNVPNVNMIARGMGTLTDITCSSLQVAGSTPKVTNPTYRLSIVNPTVANDIQGCNAFFTTPTCATAHLCGSDIGAMTITSTFSSTLQDVHFGGTFNAAAGHSVTIDRWTADPAVGPSFAGGVVPTVNP